MSCYIQLNLLSSGQLRCPQSQHAHKGRLELYSGAKPTLVAACICLMPGTTRSAFTCCWDMQAGLGVQAWTVTCKCAEAPKRHLLLKSSNLYSLQLDKAHLLLACCFCNCMSGFQHAHCANSSLLTILSTQISCTCEHFEHVVSQQLHQCGHSCTFSAPQCCQCTHVQ